jgi:hypothetical protein
MNVVKGYVEMIFALEDGTRMLFKGYGSLETVRDVDPPRQTMQVTAYYAPVVDVVTGVEVHRCFYRDQVAVFLNVRRTLNGQHYLSIADGEWRGYGILASALEEVKPETEAVVSEAPG